MTNPPDPPDPYEGREQTKIKHFILERYLSIACRIIGQSSQWGDFVYVDGFSGPWESQDDRHQDTSFMIAINVLKSAQEELEKSQVSLNSRCLFIEKEDEPFERLEAAVDKIEGVKARAIQGSFDQKIQEIKKFVGRDFSFIFVDPTGYKFTPLEKLVPILELRGEVMINFMYRFITRILTSSYQTQPEQADSIMGGSDWRSEFDELTQNGASREEAVIEVYRKRTKRFGGHKFVKSFRVAHPDINAPYFYLVYCTNNLLGLRKFSEVEEKAFALQSTGKLEKELTKKQQKTGIADLFDAPEHRAHRASEIEAKRKACSVARNIIIAEIRKLGTANYLDLLGPSLEQALVWERDVKDILCDLQSKENLISFDNFTAKQIRPNDGTIISLIR